MAEGLNRIRSVRDLNLSGKTVFIRADFNVPLGEKTDSGVRSIEDDTRIQEALPTIEYCLEQGAKIVLASHLGRPSGMHNEDESLEPVAVLLANKLDRELTLSNDCVGDGVELKVSQLHAGEILLLENLRFHAEEEKNDPTFAMKLSRLADVYINDAFGTAHRKHASTFGMAALIPERAIGLLFEKEIKILDELKDAPAHPYYAILGGSKVSDKIKVIHNLLKRVDGILIGGAMGHAFWKAKGIDIPKDAKQPSAEDVKAALSVIELAELKKTPLLYPKDTVKGFDIGEETIKEFCAFVENAKTIFWNGPLGWFEKPEYEVGTRRVAEYLADLDAKTVLGGGDTVSAINHFGLGSKFYHLSTGGGATLKYLEGEALPALNALRP